MQGVEDMVLTKQQQGCISDIISFEKARKVLFGHWVQPFRGTHALQQEIEL
jgi:hypothetical protein